MTTPPGTPQREAAFFTTIRSWGLTRGDNGFLGGVVDGLAGRIGMATLPARIIVVIGAIFLNGLVLLAYGAAWALLPDRRGNIIIQNFGRGVPNVGALIGIALFGLFGLGGLDQGITYKLDGLPWDNSEPWAVVAIVLGLMVPLAILAGIVTLIVVLVRRANTTPGAAPVFAAPPGAPATPGAAAGQTPTASEASDGDADAAPAAASATAGLSGANAATATPAPAAAASATQQWTYAAPPMPPVPPVPAYVPQPRAPRVPGPGRSFYLLALAWLVLSTGAVAWAQRQDELAVPGAAAWLALWVTGMGVIMMLVSLAGRKLGFLGFVGIMAALPTLGLIAAADDVRDWEPSDTFFHLSFGDDNGSDAGPSYDATADFARQYQEVVINGTCREQGAAADEQPTSPETTARVELEPLTQDQELEVDAQVTYLSVPEGTNLVLKGIGDAQAHVIWPGRNITCDFWQAGGTHLSLTNPDAQTLTMTVRDDAYANTIVIEEVAP